MPAHQAWPRTRSLKNHWTWRPDWRIDRPCLWWYLTFEDQPALAAALGDTRSALHRMREVDVIPPQWLHLTLTEAGFPDEVSEDRVAAAVSTVADALRDQPPLTLTLGPLTTLPGAAVLAAHPIEALRVLHRTVREATAAAGLSPAQPGEEDFWPHVSIGYLNRRADRSALMSAASATVPTRTEVTVDRVSLAAVTRRDQHYQWTVHTSLPLRTLQDAR
jgi:2'-5' RNA ligase